MKIFGIGLSGYIGSVVAEKLVAAGHEVRGLTRSEANAEILRDLGGTPVSGSMKDLTVIRLEAAAADAVVQVSIGGFLTEAKGNEAEAPAAVHAILDTLEGSGKTYLFTGGPGFWLGRADHETFVLDETWRSIEPKSYYRHWIEPYDAIMAAPGRDIRAMVVHPCAVFGRAGGYIGPVARRFQTFRRHGAVYVTWPNAAITSVVHVDDLADLYVLALEKGEPGGSYFAVSDNVPMLDVARLVSRVCGAQGAVQVVSMEKLERLEGWTGPVDFSLRMLADSEKARKDLGWRPRQGSLAAEMERLVRIGADPADIYPGPTRQAKLAGLDLARPDPEA